MVTRSTQVADATPNNFQEDDGQGVEGILPMGGRLQWEGNEGNNIIEKKRRDREYTKRQPTVRNPHSMPQHLYRRWEKNLQEAPHFLFYFFPSPVRPNHDNSHMIRDKSSK